MMTLLYHVLLGTPWWVYLVFAICIKRGVAALHTSEVNVWRMAILPAAFLIMGFSTLMQLTTAAAYFLPLYLVTLISGTIVGYHLTQRLSVKASPRLHHVIIEGSIQLLISIIAIFIVKYAEGVVFSLYPIAAGITSTTVLVFILGSIATGVFIGRFIRYLSAAQLREAHHGTS